MNGIFENPEEFGRRVSAARGYVREQKPAFGERMGVSPSTVRRWEDGELGEKNNNPLGRRQLAERVIERTGCPPGLFGLDDRGAVARELDELREQLAVLRAVVSGKGEAGKILSDLPQPGTDPPE